jgi:hypothetical protein
MMLAGWMGQADLLKGWASQGKKKGQPAPEAGEKCAGEQATFKHLKVKIKGQEMRISALFDRDVPNTMIGYGAAAILGLKGRRTRRWVTTKEGNRGMSFAWYDVPLQDKDGRIKQIRACGVLRTACVKNEGKNGEAYGDSPGGITGPAQLWECVDLVVGRDNLDFRPESTLGWPGRPKGGCPVMGTGDPGDYIKVEAVNPGRRN